MKTSILPWLLLFCVSCTNKGSSTADQAIADAEAQATLLTPKSSVPIIPVRPSVNPYDLDLSPFYPLALVIGLEAYLDAKSPILSYRLPPQADYVEIIRCNNKTVIETGLESTSIQNLAVSTLSQAQKDALYSSIDYFALALANNDCAQLSLATTNATFSDTFAPSGSWFYLVRACVTPSRLLNVGQASNRNCSRQVAISAPLLTYTNSRDDKINNALRQENIATQNITSISQKITEEAQTYSDDLDNCAKTEQDRAQALKKKNALAQLIGSGIELGIGIVTFSGGGFFAFYMHFGFMAGGFTFGHILTNIMASSSDMPRTCTSADITDSNKIKELMAQIAFQKDLQIFWKTQIDNAKNGNQVISTPNFAIPDYQAQLEEVLAQRRQITQ